MPRDPTVTRLRVVAPERDDDEDEDGWDGNGDLAALHHRRSRFEPTLAAVFVDPTELSSRTFENSSRSIACSRASRWLYS
jgi:hypothetical protein